MELYELTLHEAAEKLKSKAVSSVELTKAVLARLKAVEPNVLAFLTVTEDQALAAASAADARRAKGETGALLGMPVAIKDNHCTKGVRTTCASKILHNFIPPYDATVVEKLNAAGAVSVGKTNMDEFAMGSSTETSAFQKTRNPWNLECVPGGSSGGSAASVAAGQAFASLGSDTGGSIRQPASLCGVVGLKPTYGRVSRYGVVAFASSLDQIGPFGKDVEDCGLMLGAIAGHDPKDSTSAPVPVPDYVAEMKKPMKGLRIGVPKEFFPAEGLDPEVKAAVLKAVDTLKGLGAEVKDVSLPHAPFGLAAYYILAPSEASSNLARYDGVRFGLRVEGENIIEMYSKTRAAGFGPEVKRRIMLGTYALSSGYYDAYYLKALKVRRLLKEDYDKAFEQVDVIATPTAPTPAFKFGDKTDDPLSMYLADVFTISVNIAGVPGLSVPCGFSKTGLPIGLQLIGRPFDESTLLRAAWHHEQATDFHQQRPKLL
jgi:aspartyl-tRNA(Asn)/glutamyl-tRNA(Gln) amidotransferase subunit A